VPGVVKVRETGWSQFTCGWGGSGGSALSSQATLCSVMFALTNVTVSPGFTATVRGENVMSSVLTVCGSPSAGAATSPIASTPPIATPMTLH